jgi:hypothetical protein
MIASPTTPSPAPALNPAWRSAVVHLIVSEGWLPGASAQDIDAVYDDITFNKTAALRRLDPDSGAYFNECDVFEEDWQEAFFGKNYKKLREVKERYDPEGLFWCRSCVGSEEWEEREDGKLCRPSGWKGEERNFGASKWMLGH